MHQGFGSDEHRLSEGRAMRLSSSKVSVAPFFARSNRQISYICANKSWEKPKGDFRNGATCNHALKQWQVLRLYRGVCGNNLLNKQFKSLFATLPISQLVGCAYKVLKIWSWFSPKNKQIKPDKFLESYWQNLFQSIFFCQACQLYKHSLMLLLPPMFAEGGVAHCK